MKKSFIFILSLTIIASIFSACTTKNEIAKNPTIPKDVISELEYLYDFEFTEKYEKQVTNDFSIIFPNEILLETENNQLSLLEQFNLPISHQQEEVYESDVLSPHKIKEYMFFFDEAKKICIKTDFYEPDNLEFINCIWTDVPGAKTNLGIGVGSSEKELLETYTDSLFYLSVSDMEPIYFSLISGPDYVFDYAYTWKPFSLETNEIRDITFYISDGTISAIEMIKPFELRYVYGYDSEAGLKKANENRAK